MGLRAERAEGERTRSRRGATGLRGQLSQAPVGDASDSCLVFGKGEGSFLLLARPSVTRHDSKLFLGMAQLVSRGLTPAP